MQQLGKIMRLRRVKNDGIETQAPARPADGARKYARPTRLTQNADKLLTWRGGYQNQNLSGDPTNFKNEGKFPQNLSLSQVTELASLWNMLRGKLSEQSRLLKKCRSRILF
jgi:hypothetical protein